jgi:predicted HTH transcriptional regulator
MKLQGLPKPGQSRTTLLEAQTAQVEKAVRIYLRQHESITNRKLRELTGIGYDQAIFFFAEMVKANRLSRIGTGSATKYVLL